MIATAYTYLYQGRRAPYGYVEEHGAADGVAVLLHSDRRCRRDEALTDDEDIQ